MERELSDFDKSGKLSREEFIIAMFLIKEKMGGKELPAKLGIEYIPPKLRSIRASVTSPRPSDLGSAVSKNGKKHFISNNFLGFADPDETSLLQEKLTGLDVSVKEIQTKNIIYQKDLQTILVKKKELETQIASLKTTYDEELLKLSEIQGSIKRETLDLEKTKTELEKMQKMILSSTNEKTNLANELERIKEDNFQAKRMIQTFTEQAKTLKSELERMQAQIRDNSRFLEMNQKLANDSKSDVDNLSKEFNSFTQKLPNQTPKQAISSPNLNPNAVSVESTPVKTPEDIDPFESFRPVSSNITTGSLAPPIPTTKKPIKPDTLVDKSEIDALLESNKPKKDTSRPASGKSDIVRSPPKPFEVAFSDIIDVDAEFSAAFSDTPTSTSVTKPAVSFENAFDLASPNGAAPESKPAKTFDLNSPIVWDDTKQVKISDEDLKSAFVVEKDVSTLMDMGFSRGNFRV